MENEIEYGNMKSLLTHLIGDEKGMSNYAIILGVDKYKCASELPTRLNLPLLPGRQRPGAFVGCNSVFR